MSPALILGLVGGLLVVAFLANRVFGLTRITQHRGSEPVAHRDLGFDESLEAGLITRLRGSEEFLFAAEYSYLLHLPDLRRAFCATSI